MPIWFRINKEDNVCFECGKTATHMSIMKNVNLIKYSCEEHIKEKK